MYGLTLKEILQNPEYGESVLTPFSSLGSSLGVSSNVHLNKSA